MDACGGCDDGVACTDDVCDPGSRTCQVVPDDSFCADNDFLCDGEEICVPGVGCGHSGNPCEVGTYCNQGSYSCEYDSFTDPNAVAGMGDSMTRAFAAPCTSGSRWAAS